MKLYKESPCDVYLTPPPPPRKKQQNSAMDDHRFSRRKQNATHRDRCTHMKHHFEVGRWTARWSCIKSLSTCKAYLNITPQNFVVDGWQSRQPRSERGKKKKHNTLPDKKKEKQNNSTDHISYGEVGKDPVGQQVTNNDHWVDKVDTVGQAWQRQEAPPW